MNLGDSLIYDSIADDSSTTVIYWPENIPISQLDLESDIKFVKDNMAGLVPIYRDEMSRLELYAKNRNISLHAILSIRNQIKIQKEIKSSRYINENKIIDEFNKLIWSELPGGLIQKQNLDLKQIMNFYSKIMYAPIIVIKIISKLPLFKELSHDLTKKFYQIFKDINKIEHKSKILSQKFEHTLEKFLSKYHISFLTETDIRNNEISHLTPDILFEQPVTINVNGTNKKIKWMDAKNFIFMGTYTPFMYKKIVNQAKKYYTEFGQGAFVFRYGFVDHVHINGAYLLDGSKL
jgi:hypothetical protein